MRLSLSDARAMLQVRCGNLPILVGRRSRAKLSNRIDPIELTAAGGDGKMVIYLCGCQLAGSLSKGLCSIAAARAPAYPTASPRPLGIWDPWHRFRRRSSLHHARPDVAGARARHKPATSGRRAMRLGQPSAPRSALDQQHENASPARKHARNPDARGQRVEPKHKFEPKVIGIKASFALKPMKPMIENPFVHRCTNLRESAANSTAPGHNNWSDCFVDELCHRQRGATRALLNRYETAASGSQDKRFVPS